VLSNSKKPATGKHTTEPTTQEVKTKKKIKLFNKLNTSQYRESVLKGDGFFTKKESKTYIFHL
jgi:hypothetical protein